VITGCAHPGVVEMVRGGSIRGLSGAGRFPPRRHKRAPDRKHHLRLSSPGRAAGCALSLHGRTSDAGLCRCLRGGLYTDRRGVRAHAAGSPELRENHSLDYRQPPGGSFWPWQETAIARGGWGHDWTPAPRSPLPRTPTLRLRPLPGAPPTSPWLSPAHSTRRRGAHERTTRTRSQSASQAGSATSEGGSQPGRSERGTWQR